MTVFNQRGQRVGYQVNADMVEAVSVIREAGRKLGQYAKKHGWDSDAVAGGIILTAMTSGPDVHDCLLIFGDGFTKGAQSAP